MSKASATVVACATLLWAGTALATATAQQNCDYARISAWKVYQACVENVVAKDAKGVAFDEFAAFARCRHAYFRKWPAFQNPHRKPSLVGSTCIGNRFTDNGDQTVTDDLSGLVWEKKDNMDGTPNYADPHDANNSYTWGFTVSPSAPDAENGRAFTEFLAALNAGGGFAGANGWRLPTLAELQTILLDFPCGGHVGGSKCSCPSVPCVDPALDSANTSGGYWSAASQVTPSYNVWIVDFAEASVLPVQKTGGAGTRAARGGRQ